MGMSGVGPKFSLKDKGVCGAGPFLVAALLSLQQLFSKLNQ
jgi:hypothetical protein